MFKIEDFNTISITDDILKQRKTNIKYETENIDLTNYENLHNINYY